MDDGLSKNDPYREMETGEEGIQPDFLKGKASETAQGVLGAAEQVAGAVMAAKGGGKIEGKTAGSKGSSQGVAGGLAGGKTSAKQGFEDGLKSGGSMAEKAEANEKSPNGLYSGGKGSHESNVKGEKGENEPSLKMPTGLKMMAPILLIFLAMFGIIALIVALPVMMIGAIDYNLQKALGFFGTVGILEEQGGYVTAELAKSGNFPTKYSSDLASNGLDVGQVTANGDFIKTDTYIANIEERDDLVAAASGFSYNSDEEGELALLYDGKVIRADDFVAAVESDPKLYAAYSAAADLSVKYYYGKDVSKVYKDMKLSRGSFNEWEITGDYKADEASYNEIMEQILDGKTNADLNLGGVQDDLEPTFPGIEVASCWARNVLSGIFGKCTDKNGTFIESVSEGEASEITEAIAEKTKKYVNGWHIESDRCYESKTNPTTGEEYREYYDCQVADYDDTQNKRAAELLNTAVSAKEPYIAARAFMGVEEPIQRARIGDNGPVNQLMNTLSTPTSVTYKDVITGDTVTKNISIFETVNFQAAVGEKPYSTDEAASFARDRVLKVTGQTDADIIKSATVSSNGFKKSTTAVKNGDHTSADKDIISKANDSIEMAITKKNSELFESIVGGNRILEGGSFLSNNINQKVIGAMPSDDATVAAYQVELNEVIARKEEADRASLSPFDISSPNTFLGSIVHNLATAMIGSYSSGTTSIFSTIQAAGNVAGDAVANLTGTASAESANQQYTSLSTDYCPTPKDTIGVSGDLYCTSHNTPDTSNMTKTLSDWKNSAIGSSLEDDGKIKKDSEVDKFFQMGMYRESSVGTKNAEVCTLWHKYNDGLFDQLTHFFTNIVGLYEVCGGDDEDLEKVALGTEYSFTSGHNDNLGLYSGYMLYNQVRSLLTDEDSAVAVARERYYAEHPRDDSEAGEIARISGMTKAEAEIALAYSDYLTYIANYDASDRHYFGEVDLGISTDDFGLKIHSDKMAGDFVAWYIKEAEFKDLRELTTSA
ncbi:hypothetical protein IJG93_01285 [Candidatus Saccharibacteria bacterium]|nr:hypothetical protein [Candidatus Saccharibacteria bacterium]